MNEKYMQLAIKEAKKAYNKGEVPIGAVIVKNSKVIAKGYNKKEKSRRATGHAEIMAINKACRKLKNWRLEGCVLYVTVEPCMMCLGAIIESRIKKIVYGTKNQYYNFVNNQKIIEKNNIQIEADVCNEKCKKILQDFFKKKRI